MKDEKDELVDELNLRIVDVEKNMKEQTEFLE